MLEGADAVLAMYHDQGLPVLKHAAFGDAVNVTLGLPIDPHLGRPRHRARPRRRTARSTPAASRAAIALAVELARAPLTMLPKARKRFGQHFLTDRHYLARIVAAIDPKPGEAIVEIGPGPGALTERARRARRPPARDRDRPRPRRRAARALPRASASSVHEGDVLEFDFATLPAPLRVVGNLPYNISTPILFRVAAHARAHPRLRLHAAEGSRRAHGGRARTRRTTGASR